MEFTSTTGSTNGITVPPAAPEFSNGHDYSADLIRLKTAPPANENLDRALALAEMGLAVFPCRPQDKRPFTPHGFHDASTDANAIASWWKRWPDALVGLPTGKENGLAVADLDKKGGKDWTVSARKAGLILPDTHTITTRSGGLHKYYRYPADVESVTTTANLFKHLVGSKETGIDVRGDGGYVILWGDLNDQILSDLTEWPTAVFADATKRDEEAGWAEYEKKHPALTQATPTNLDDVTRRRYERFLEFRLADLSAATKPGRNDMLYRAVCKFAPCVGKGLLDAGALEHGLIEACKANGLVRDNGLPDVRKTIAAGLKFKDHPLAALPERTDHSGRVEFSLRSGATEDVDFQAAVASAVKPTQAPKLKIYNLATLLKEPAPPRKWVIEGLIPDEEVSSLGGDGGLGKSTLMLQIGCACASGRDWMGIALKRTCKVLYFSCEDDQDEVHFRAEQISSAEALPLSLENFDAIEPEEDTILAAPDRAGRITPTPLFLWLEKYIEENSITLLMLDSVADVFGGDELNRSHVRGFLQLLRARIARKLKCPVLFLYHPSVSGMRDGRGYSGVTHWNNGVRSRLYLESVKNEGNEEEDTDFRTLKLMKANRAKAGLKIGLRWKDGRFIQEDEKSATSILQRVADEELFLKLLDKVTAEGRNVCATPSSTYAPTVFAKHPDAKGVSKTRLEKAMNILFSVDKIRIEEFGRPGKQRKRLAKVE